MKSIKNIKKMKDLELLREQSGVEHTENNKSFSSESTTYEGANEQIGNTPLVARVKDGKWFATIGRYKVSELHNDREELENYYDHRIVTWEDLAYLSAAIQDYNETVNNNGGTE